MDTECGLLRENNHISVLEPHVKVTVKGFGVRAVASMPNSGIVLRHPELRQWRSSWGHQELKSTEVQVEPLGTSKAWSRCGPGVVKTKLAPNNRSGSVQLCRLKSV